jgi:hypothetical protein
MVVNLAVENDGRPPAGAEHRLRPGGRQIENGEPDMPKPTIAERRAPFATPVRPAVRHGGDRHRGRVAAWIETSYESTHGLGKMDLKSIGAEPIRRTYP